MYFKVSEDTRDLVLKNGSLVLCNDKESLIQTCECAVRQLIFELPFNATNGIDYFNNIISSNPNYRLFESQVRTALSNVEGVSSVLEFSYRTTFDENKNRILEYTALIRSNNEDFRINANLQI